MNSNDPLKQALELQHAGNIDEALSVCLSLAEQQPGDFRIHFLLGMLYQQLDKAESAIHHFTESSRLHPELPSAFYNLGVLFFSKGNMEQAVEAYTKAGHLNPDDPDIFYNLALSQKKLGLVKEARKNYEKVLSLNPADTDALYNLGVLCRETGKTEEAIRYFEAAGALYNAATARFNVALALAQAGRLADAREYAHAALRNFQTYGDRAADKIQKTQGLIAEIERAMG